MNAQTGDYEKLISIVIADDQQLYRESLRDLISHWCEFEVLEVCANGKEAVEIYRSCQPDLVLLDVQMPDISGPEAAHYIRTEFPTAVVIMMSITNSDPGLTEAIQVGACGYFLKEIHPNRLRHLLHGWSCK